MRKIFKRSYHGNYTAWIPTNFYVAVKTTKYASWVVQYRGKQIQHGGRLPS